MSDPRWEEVARLFGLVMDADTAERASVLDRECGGDVELRREVEELLQADEASGDLVGPVVGKVVADAVEQIVTVGAVQVDGEQNALTEAGLTAGTLIDGRYEVTRLLGAGGMGVVVAAKHHGLAEDVAIKLLKPGALATERARRRFIREAKAAARIKSPHVVKVRDVGTLSTGAPYMVMDLLEGADLAAVIHRRGALPYTEACRITLQTCEALATAHARAVVHRDIKPGNLFLERAAHGDLAVKLLDFGISKLGEGDEEGVLTRSTDMVGSPAYMSPEQLRSSRDVDARSDIWSLGVVLYELLAGVRPFRAASLADVSMMILAEPPPPLEGNGPPGLRHVVQRCLEKDRAARYADVGELAVALAPFCGREGHRGARRVCVTLGAPPPDDGFEGLDESVDDGSDSSLDCSLEASNEDSDEAAFAPTVAMAGKADDETTTEAASLAAAPPAPPKRGPMAAAALVLGVLLAGGAWLASSSGDGISPAPDASASNESASGQSASSTAASSPPTETPTTPAAPSASATTSAAAPPTPAPPPRPITGPMPSPPPEPAPGLPTVDPYDSRK